MSETALVSIVVPVYNTASYLPQCLDSLVGQTLRDIEIVCVDDGSTDGSAALLDARAAADSRLRVFHQPNGGVSRARNVGLAQARGSYVLFADSDDYLEPRACECLLERAQRDDADIVVFSGDTFPRVAWINRALSTRDATLRDNPFAALFSEVGSYPLMCNKLYRRELLEAHDLHFNEELSLGEDHAFQMCVFPHARTVSFMPHALYHYRCEREGSAMSVMQDKVAAKAANHLSLVEYVLDVWKREGWLAEHRAELLKWSCDLLEQDFPSCPYAVREKLAPRYRALVDGYGLADVISNPYLRRSVRFFGGADLGAREPLVSIIVAASGSGTRENFAALANQSHQSLELLCVPESTQAADELAELMSDDPRARAVESRQVALNEARGRYVLFANLCDAYAWDALGTMLEALAAARAEGKEPQFACVRDSLGVLECADLSRLLPLYGSSWLPIEVLGDALVSAVSPSLANKLWLTSFAREQKLGEENADQVIGALRKVMEFCPCEARLVTMGERAGIDEDWLVEQVESLREELGFLRGDLNGRTEQLDAINNSASFKIGRAATGIPRAIRSLARSARP